MRLQHNGILTSRAVQIELFTAQVLCRASCRVVLVYLTDTGLASNYAVIRKNGTVVSGSSFRFIIQQWFEINQNNARNASEILIKQSCSLQKFTPGMKAHR